MQVSQALAFLTVIWDHKYLLHEVCGKIKQRLGMWTAWHTLKAQGIIHFFSFLGVKFIKRKWFKLNRTDHLTRRQEFLISGADTEVSFLMALVGFRFWRTSTFISIRINTMGWAPVMPSHSFSSGVPCKHLATPYFSQKSEVPKYKFTDFWAHLLYDYLGASWSSP